MDEHAVLWEQLRGGSKRALSQLFKIFYPRLFDYGTKLVKDREIAKDSIQEVFINLWVYRNSLKAVNSVTAYLISSIRRTVIRKARETREAQKRQRNIRSHMFKDAINVEEMIILFEVEEEMKKQLKQAIRELTARQKEAVYLKYYEGLSHEEISGIMGINLQSVYNLTTEAIKQLKNFICAQDKQIY